MDRRLTLVFVLVLAGCTSAPPAGPVTARQLVDELRQDAARFDAERAGKTLTVSGELASRPARGKDGRVVAELRTTFYEKHDTPRVRAVFAADPAVQHWLASAGPGQFVSVTGRVVRNEQTEPGVPVVVEEARRH